MADVRLLILASRFQNAFFTELADVLRAEATGLGARAEIVREPVEPEAGDVFVVLPPHEYAALEGESFCRDPRVAARTIGITAEQPGSSHFETNCEIGARLGATFDFSAHAVAAYRRVGIEAQHLPFGWTPSWDRFGTGDRAAGPELLFLGCASERRTFALAGLCRHLRTRRSRLVLSDNSTPNVATSPSFIAGDAKRSLLADTTILLNIHQTSEPYFEWLRVAEAAHCGTVVLTEPALHMEPFVPGTHVAVRTLSGMPAMLDDLLDDEARLEELRGAAYEELRLRPFARAVERLLDVAATLDSSGAAGVVGPTRQVPFSHGRPTHWQRDRTENDVVRQAMRDIRLDLIDLRRQLALHDLHRRGVDGEPGIRYRTPAADAATAAPAVSVLLAIHDHAHYVTAALDSVAGSSVQDVEIVVVDDGSTDGSGDVVEGWMRSNPDLRASLVAHPVNLGLPRARNEALAHATAELCFILDADNELLPTGLEQLSSALQSDEQACFAYGVLQRFDSERPVGLLGYLPWEPQRLREANYIDAMALIRTHVLRNLGGFTTDRRLHGWEDYDLWCRIAEHGGWAVHVPTVVGRYRASATSMLSLTNVSVDAAFDALREHAPRLMAGLTTGPTSPSIASPDAATERPMLG